jgi:hypothetical protein
MVCIMDQHPALMPISEVAGWLSAPVMNPFLRATQCVRAIDNWSFHELTFF